MLADCPTCGKEISIHARTCPRCGEPNAGEQAFKLASSLAHEENRLAEEEARCAAAASKAWKKGFFSAAAVGAPVTAAVFGIWLGFDYAIAGAIAGALIFGIITGSICEGLAGSKRRRESTEDSIRREAFSERRNSRRARIAFFLAVLIGGPLGGHISGKPLNDPIYWMSAVPIAALTWLVFAFVDAMLPRD